MRIPKIVMGLNPNNMGISIDFMENVDANFAVHIENFLYSLGHKYGGLPSTNNIKIAAEQSVNRELTRLITMGLLKLDIDGTWYMAHVEDLSNIGTDAVYKRHLDD
jgi:hypothetical protein